MWDYRAGLIRVIDGDSVVLMLDQGFNGRQEEEIRLLNVSAPERNELGGAESRKFVEDWFLNLDYTLRWPLYVKTVPNTNVEPNEKRTFVRYLATIWKFGNMSQSLNGAVTQYLTEHPEWGTGK